MKERILSNAAISSSNFVIASSLNGCSSCSLATEDALSVDFDVTISISPPADSQLSLAGELSPLGLVTTSLFPFVV
jgi:hypothetical protein